METTWSEVNAIVYESGKLDEDILGLTLAVMSGCDYCISVFTAAARSSGLDDEPVLEIMTGVDLLSGPNRFNFNQPVVPDRIPWYGCRII